MENRGGELNANCYSDYNFYDRIGVSMERLTRCPLCNGFAKIIDSRSAKDSVRRRRECIDCGYRFTTYEITKEDYLKWRVLKKIARF